MREKKNQNKRYFFIFLIRWFYMNQIKSVKKRK